MTTKGMWEEYHGSETMCPSFEIGYYEPDRKDSAVGCCSFFNSFCDDGCAFHKILKEHFEMKQKANEVKP